MVRLAPGLNGGGEEDRVEFLQRRCTWEQCVAMSCTHQLYYFYHIVPDTLAAYTDFLLIYFIDIFVLIYVALCVWQVRFVKRLFQLDFHILS